MNELSNEMKQELVNEFRRDCDRCLQETTFSWSADGTQGAYANLNSFYFA